MKVVIDRELCQGHALCARTSSAIFELDDEGFGFVKSEDVPEELRAEAEASVQNCPEQAISIID
jgi:ferredoxin